MTEPVPPSDQPPEADPPEVNAVEVEMMEADPPEVDAVEVELVAGVADGAAAPIGRGRHVVLAALLLGATLLITQGGATSSVGTHATRLVGDGGQVPDPGGTPVPYEPGATADAPTTQPSRSTTTRPGSVATTVPAEPGGPVDTSTPAATTVVVTTVPPAPESDGSTREVPEVQSDAPTEVTGPWDAVTATTAAGYVTTQLGCASGTSAGALDAFFRERVGPVLGEDYQHVYPLGGKRYLWLFQDTFVDHSGAVTHLGRSAFAHNVAMVQDGACFTLYHRGTTGRPSAFEQGDGDAPTKKWFWPMGGELVNGRLSVFWVEMRKDPYNPDPPDGLGWHPVRTWLATYDPATLQRLSFRTAPNASPSPVYGYAVATQGEWTYLFGNTFEQNMLREGGYANGPHSATAMYLARVPAGQLGAAPEYRTADGWSGDPAQAVPIVSRFWAENPMQPRFLGGQWVSVAKVDGYWGDELVVDVAIDPWGPWTTVDRRGLSPRGGDPLMNTYHAHLLPWLDGGSLVVSISQNARNMTRDAYPQPSRYRIGFFTAALIPPPPPTTTTTTVEETTTTAVDTTTTVEPTTTTESTTTSTTTTTTTSTTIPPTTTTSTTTTIPPGTTTSSTTTSTAASTTTTSTTPAPPATAAA